MIPKTKQYVASEICLDFSFAEELEAGREFEVELLYFNMLFANKFYIYKYISTLSCLNKIYEKSWCASVQTFNSSNLRKFMIGTNKKQNSYI